MPTIFLSYRRADTGGYAGRLADALAARFGRGSVFQDVETIAPGSNFAEAIVAAIARCKVMLVLIGDTWLTERGADGGLRLDDPGDYVRLEVAAGLRAATTMLPVLVEGARMPGQNALPSDLKPLARLQAMELSDTRWDYDVERLAHALRTMTGDDRSPARRRALLLAGAGVATAMIAALAGYLALSEPVDVAGRWNLPDGSFWIVVQEGGHLIIEETHYESKQVWKRGSGTTEKDRVSFVLDTIYGNRRRYEGALRLSRDGSTLSGEVRDALTGSRASMALTRNR